MKIIIPPAPDAKVQTNGLGKVLRIVIESPAQNEVMILGYDNADNKTLYIHYHAKILQGVNLIEFPLPISPKTLALSFQMKGQAVLKSVSFTEEITRTPIKVSPEIRQYISDIAEFAIGASHLPTGDYSTKDKKTYWRYTDNILINGQIANTPAATYVESGNMLFSRNFFLKMTVAQRIFTMLHERAHHELGIGSDIEAPQNEVACDLWAKEIFEALGYSKKDYQTLIGTALTPNSQNYARMNVLYQ